ncbi:MAG TPA: hypothetical protein VEI03_14235 [Stellaceae bacterium]|nr:hypothetical protein [Stellaceae bacterium]
MAVAAPSIASDAISLREVAVALRAFVAAKGGQVGRAFAVNLEAIAREIDAAAQPGAAPDHDSLCAIARRLCWFALCSDIPTADLLFRLAKATEESVSRPAAARALLPLRAAPAPLTAEDGRQRAVRPVRWRWLAGGATAMLAALAIAVWGLSSPPAPRIVNAEKTVPVSPPAPPTISAAPEPEPESPVVATAPAAIDVPAPPAIDAPAPPAASAAPADTEEIVLRNAVAEPQPTASFEAASAPKPRRSAPAGETQSRMTRALDAAGTDKAVPPPAPPSAAHAQEARRPGMGVSTPTKMPRAARPEPADAARALMLRELGLVGGARTEVAPPASDATPVPPEAPKQ